MEAQNRGGVYSNINVAKVTLMKVPDKPGMAADIFGALGAKNVNVELVVNTSVEPGLADVAFVVAESTVSVVEDVMSLLVESLKGEGIKVDHEVATISVRSVDPGPKVTPNLLFTALAKEGINIEMISSSLWGVTCVIRQDRLQDAMAAVKKLQEE
jgi:aspartate kinase